MREVYCHCRRGDHCGGGVCRPSGARRRSGSDHHRGLQSAVARRDVSRRHQAAKFDIANGIDITFIERPPDAYAAQFNSGEFQVGGSASVLIVGLGTTRGIKTSYLFNMFDYFGTVVTGRPEIKTLADLNGKQARRRQGHHELHDVRLVRQAAGRRSGLAPGGEYRNARPGRLRAGRSRRCGADLGAGLYAGQGASGRRFVPSISTSQRSGATYAGGGVLPNLGVAAHQEWIDTASRSDPADFIAPTNRPPPGSGQPGRCGAAGRPVKDDAQRRRSWR